MESNWASEHLQVIRTLMERVAVYRRALAPVMLSVGIVGTVAASIAILSRRIETTRGFAVYWMVTAAICVAVAYFLVRRQALKDQEPFWSPPTRQVTEALTPGFLAGALLGILPIVAGEQLPQIAWLIALAWVIAYGCALHAAGFFMPRGIKLFGLLIVAFASVLLLVVCLADPLHTTDAGHAVMGVFFGLVQLAYGGYLRITERRA